MNIGESLRQLPGTGIWLHETQRLTPLRRKTPRALSGRRAVDLKGGTLLARGLVRYVVILSNRHFDVNGMSQLLSGESADFET